MIDFKLFFRYLWRFKWLIIVAPIVGVATAYYFVRDLPDSYKSVAQVSALSTASATPGVRSFQLTSYVVELAKSRRLVNSLGYHLILHDLENEARPFREWSEEVKKLSPEKRTLAIQAFRERLKSQTLLSIADDSGPVKLFSMVNSMGYGQSKLQDDLRISKNDITGVIDVGFTSENPDLSVFVVNTLSADLVGSFNLITEVGKDNSLAILDSVLQDKYRIMNEKKDVLNNYKAGSGVISSGAQSYALYGRVSNYEQQRAVIIREIQALKGAIQSMDDRLNNASAQQAVGLSADVLLLDEQLFLANPPYIEGGF